MSECMSIMQGPEDFERLLKRAGLSEREAQAARSAVLGLTAGQAAPVIGVSASTVGSYRQRAWAKLGVATLAEFMQIDAVAEWKVLLDKSGASNVRYAQKGQKPADELVEPQDTNTRPTCTTSPQFNTRHLVPLVAAFSVAIIASVVAFWAAMLPQGPDYLNSPQGVVETAYGEVPNVTGMRADAAATAVASAGFLPEFEPCVSEHAAGTVLEVSAVEVVDVHKGDVSSLNWGTGSTGSYDRRHGDWTASVVLVVAV